MNKCWDCWIDFEAFVKKEFGDNIVGMDGWFDNREKYLKKYLIQLKERVLFT